MSLNGLTAISRHYPITYNRAMRVDGDSRWIKRPVVLGIASALVLSVSAILPILGSLFALAAPAPVAVAAFRHGRYGLIAALVAALLTWPLGGSFASLAIFVFLAAFGILPGAALRHGRGTRQTIMAMVGSAAIGFLAVALLSLIWRTGAFSLRAATSMLATIPRNVLAGLKADLTLSYSGQGISHAAAARLAAHQVAAFSTLLYQSWPFIVLLSLTAFAAISFAISRAALARLRVELPPVTPFMYYVGPAWPAPGFLLGLAIVLLGAHYHTLGATTSVGTNIMLAFGTLLVLQGLSVLYYVFTRLGFSKWLRMMLVAIFLIVPFALQVLPWVGIGDSLLDWRRIRVER